MSRMEEVRATTHNGHQHTLVFEWAKRGLDAGSRLFWTHDHEDLPGSAIASPQSQDWSPILELFDGIFLNRCCVVPL